MEDNKILLKKRTFSVMMHQTHQRKRKRNVYATRHQKTTAGVLLNFCKVQLFCLFNGNILVLINSAILRSAKISSLNKHKG